MAENAYTQHLEFFSSKMSYYVLFLLYMKPYDFLNNLNPSGPPVHKRWVSNYADSEILPS